VRWGQFKRAARAKSPGVVGQPSGVAVAVLVDGVGLVVDAAAVDRVDRSVVQEATADRGAEARSGEHDLDDLAGTRGIGGDE